MAVRWGNQMTSSSEKKVNQTVTEQKEIPAYLSSFPKIHPTSPVETKHQTLPIDQLTWENFERLCYKLAQREGQIEACSLYGTRGQDQAGIDIYSLQSGQTKYSTYQCKHENDFGPQKIENAVTEFINGSWLARSNRFVLCAKESLRSTLRQEKIESQRTLLSASGLSFEVWDLEELSSLLKGHPDLVDDFFGRQWVKAFNGEDAANNLRYRLEGKDFAKIRERFTKFYSLVFQQNDPGIPHQCATAVESPSLHDRYVIPEIIEKKSYDLAIQRKATEEKDNSTELGATPVLPTGSDFAVIRRPIDFWLNGQNRCALLGAPGSGKSSLLRFLALDILSDNPRLPGIHQRWGSHLPIWIPFAFWTRLVESNPEFSSLPSVFKKWLQTWDEDAEFISLFEKSLEDNRLIIFVDGLDEWANDKAASVALQQLQVFVQKHSLNCIVTCRTYSYAKHELSLGGWPTIELAPFNKNQQELFSAHWFARSLSYDAGGRSLSEFAPKAMSLASDFLSEARRVPALFEFLENPLLLGLLLVQKILKLSLPSKREKVIEALVSLLVAEHPKAREAAAKVTTKEQIDSDELIQLLEYLAFEGMMKYPEGGFPKDKLKELIETYLKSDEIGFGWDTARARQFSGVLIKEASEKLGVIVEKSPQTIGFYHRTIQEYLASKHLMRSSIPQQKETLLMYCGELTWRQTILFFFSQVQRESDVKELIQFIESELLTNPKSKNSAYVLLANLIYLNTNCPITTIRRVSPSLLDELYKNPDFETKAGILDAGLNGLCTSRSKDTILEQIENWYPNRTNWRRDLIAQCAHWPTSPELLNFLWRGLFDETTGNQRATAQTIAHLEKGNPDTAGKLKDLFRQDPRSTVRAVALEALIIGWPTDSESQALVKLATNDTSPDVRLMGFIGTFLFTAPQPEHLEELIKLSRYPGGVDYNWKDLAVDTIAKYWGKDDSLKKRCLESVRAPYAPEKDIERDTAWHLLITGFSGDSEVASAIADGLQGEKPLVYLSREVWHLLPIHFPKNKTIEPAFEKWAEKDTHHERELSLATGVAPTDTIKKTLINRLESWVPHWAAEALLTHWPNDQDTVSTLQKFVSENDGNASAVGYLLPKIIKDQGECRKKLLELLRRPDIRRIDFVMSGLVEVDNGIMADDVVDAFFSVPRESLSLINSAGADLLIRKRPDSPKVKELALKQLKQPEGLHGAVAYGYRSDPEFRKLILPLLFPLENELRFDLVKRLAIPDIDVSLRKRLLSQYRAESSPNIKTYASIGYHKCLDLSEHEAAINELSKDLWLVGPTYQQGRQAAFCGLVELKRVDLIKNAQNPYKEIEEKYFTLPPDSGSDSNLILREYISENWTYLRDNLEERFATVISGGKDSLDNVWEDLAEFADTVPEISVGILEYLERIKVTSSPSLTYFWRKQRPKSEGLLECCLKILEGDDSRRGWRNTENDYIAAEIIGNDFYERDDICSRLETMVDADIYNHRALLALSIGWPDSSKLKNAFDYYSSRKIGIDFILFVHLVALHSTAERVGRLAEEVIDRVSGRSDNIRRLVLPAIERRLKSDSDATKAFFDRIKSLDTEIDLQVTLIQLAVRFGLDLASLSDWAGNYLVKAKESPPLRAKDLLTERNIWLEDVIGLITP